MRPFGLPVAHREEAGRVLAACKAQCPDVLYGVLLVGGRVLTVLQPKQPVAHRLHAADLRLIVNFVQTQGARRDEPVVNTAQGTAQLYVPTLYTRSFPLVYLFSFGSFLVRGPTCF